MQSHRPKPCEEMAPSELPIRFHGWPRRWRQYGVLAIFLTAGLFVGRLEAAPLAQAGDARDAETSSAAITAQVSATPGVGTASPVTGTPSHSSTTALLSGTVVTDSPLIRTVFSVSAEESPSASLGQSQFATPQATSGTATASSSQFTSILPSPTTNDEDPGTTQQEKTYNSLVNFYFLILAGVIALAVLAWYIWRRRRRGKTTRDRRRGLEALRRDLELGRLRRGILGVVGRGGNSNSTPPNEESTPANEELPAYVPQLRRLMGRYNAVRTPPPALTRPPEYEESVRPRTANGQPLHTIHEEQSRSQTPDTPFPPGDPPSQTA